MKVKHLLVPFAIVQTLLGIRVVWRLLRSMRGERIQFADTQTEHERVSVIVPVLNEYNRLAPCLEGLITQGAEVSEILVVDGGSADGTQQLVSVYTKCDPRVRLVRADPIPAGYNGKAYGLHMGLCSVRPDTDWILTIDADVHAATSLVSALLTQAKQSKLAALSVATLQEIATLGEGLLHPSLLATLVYRFGIPGHTYHRVSEVQANGQCFLFRRNALEACGGFVSTYHSVCEDVTIARILVSSGYSVGFYEAGDLVTVRMYADWYDTWDNWTRSLPMHDQFSGINTLLGWLEVMLVQALPLPLFLLHSMTRIRWNWFLLLNTNLFAIRIGVLFGTTRAYRRRPWSYWLSPLCDLPVALKLGRSILQRQHSWRGRVLVRGDVS